MVPELDSLGYRYGWAGEVARRISEAGTLLRASREVVSKDLNRVLSCQGWWEASQLTRPVPPGVPQLNRGLVVEVTTAYLEESMVWGPRKPIEFVRDYLTTESHFDPLTATWLHLQSPLEQTELANGLAARISLLVESWPQVLDGTQVSLGPVVESLSVNGVVLRGDTVHLVSGDRRLGVEVSWPGAVLVRFVAEPVRPSHLEEMDLAAIVHGLATGCPPQRVVAYDLGTGQGMGMDVEREWLELTIGSICAALRDIAEVERHGVTQLTPGEHCVECPWRDDCTEGVASEYLF